MMWLTLFVLKSTVILLAAWAACALLRRRSAALRHFVWTAGFGAVLLCGTGIPARVALPATQPVLIRAVPMERAAAVGKPTQPRMPVPLPLALYIVGAGLVAAWFLAGAVRTAWLVRRGVTADYTGAEGVKVIESGCIPVPLAWGVLRPVIVLPESARRWPQARLEAVLLHERMHIRRRDLLAQAVAQAACALAWFNPLAWIALGRLRKERECACDDAVLASGVPAPDYATHLVDLARGLAATRRRLSDAPAMAEAAGLEARVRALLDGGRDRRPLNRRAAVAVVSTALAVALPIAVVTAWAQAVGGSLAGIVTDPSGARVPGCKVVAKNLDGNNEEVASVNAAAEYQFTSIPPGHYALEFRAPGFAVTKTDAVVIAGAAARADGQLDLGQISESVTVHGEKPPAAAIPRSAATPAQRIRVGGNVAQAKLISQTKPVYPDDLQQLGIQGNVVIRAVISKDGAVLNPKVINTVDSRLAQAALDAVTQWRYEPSRLNGQPVEIVTTITVAFDLNQLRAGFKKPR